VKRVAIFLSVCAASALFFWLAGFDFDRRGLDVAHAAVSTIFIAALAAFTDKLP
jgi:hypothetical protein